MPQVLAPGGGELTHSVSSGPTRVEGHGRARGSQAGCALCLAIQWPTPPVQVVETPCECRDKASSCGGVERCGGAGKWGPYARPVSDSRCASSPPLADRRRRADCGIGLLWLGGMERRYTQRRTRAA